MALAKVKVRLEVVKPGTPEVYRQFGSKLLKEEQVYGLIAGLYYVATSTDILYSIILLFYYCFTVSSTEGLQQHVLQPYPKPKLRGHLQTDFATLNVIMTLRRV